MWMPTTRTRLQRFLIVIAFERTTRLIRILRLVAEIAGKTKWVR